MQVAMIASSYETLMLFVRQMIKNSIVAIIKPQTEILNFKIIYGLISNFNFSIGYLLNVYRFFTNLIKFIDS